MTAVVSKLSLFVMVLLGIMYVFLATGFARNTVCKIYNIKFYTEVLHIICVNRWNLKAFPQSNHCDKGELDI